MTAPPPAPAHAWLVPALALAAGLVAWFVLHAPDPERGFEIDEAEYLAMGLFSVEQLLGEDDATRGGNIALAPGEDPGTWRGGVHEVTFGFMSPGLPKLVFGTVVRAVLPADTVVSPLIFRRFAPEGVPNHKAKALRLGSRHSLAPALEPARAVTTGLAALAAALLAAASALVVRTFDRRPWTTALGAAAATGLWLSAPAVQDAAHYVRPGLFPVVFWALALVLFLVALGNRAPALARGEAIRPSPLLLVGLGLCLGLAAAGKLNGVLLAAVIPTLLWPLTTNKPRVLMYSACVWGLGALVFYLFNPGLWSAPVQGTDAILAGWRGDMRWQTEQYGGTLRVAESRFDALQLSFGALLREAGPLAGVVPYVGTILCVLGLTAVGLGMRRSRADHGLYWYAVLLLFGSALIVPMERMRYFLPMVGPLAICGGVLVARLAVGRRRSHEH